MLIFMIHGLANSSIEYADQFKTKIKKFLTKKNTELPIFYASFWGHAFKNQTDELFNWVKADIKEISNKCRQLSGFEPDIYRYQQHREDFIAKFFGDFLTYLNTDKGIAIRKEIVNQFQDFISCHPEEKDIIFIAHSLGTLILWDLLFAQDLSQDDCAYKLRKMFNSQENKLKLSGIVTMGSPLLFMRLKQNIDFSAVDKFNHNNEILAWLNIIHASDLIAYPLGNAIKHDQTQNLFFTDQYLWIETNIAERAAIIFGQAHAGMALGLADAHSSYWNNDIVVDLISSLVIKDFKTLGTKKVHTGWHSYSEDGSNNS